MKKIIVRQIDPQILTTIDRSMQKINEINWVQDFPYRPDVSFSINHDCDSIFLYFEVKEETAKALRIKDNEDVWNDSCVEFFIAFEGESFYYCIEANCIGTILVSLGSNRSEREYLATDEVFKIERTSSLGTKPVSGDEEITDWNISLRIPKDIFIHSKIQSFSGMRARGNFYKCGDELKTPHFISWNRIESETPNFHLPEFFGEIEFE